MKYYESVDLDFNQYLGDPRDVQSETYRGLSTIRDSYFQKYNSRMIYGTT